MLITSLALKSACSAVWVVQIISRQFSKWKLILSTPLHTPDSSPSVSKNTKNRNISIALRFELSQLEISVSVSTKYWGWQHYHPLQNVPAACYIYSCASKWKKKKKDSVTEMSILTVHSWVLALRKLMASQPFSRTVWGGCCMQADSSCRLTLLLYHFSSSES